MKRTEIILMAAVAVAGFLAGCSGLQLKLENASVDPPSNVVVYFTVDKRDGEPVAGMTADQFNIYEDGKLISKFESKQTILNPEVATVRYTLLLLDMSSSVVESGQVPLVQDAVHAFVREVGEQEQVAIYAFDGRAEILPIAEFGAGRNTLMGRSDRLSAWKTKDPSTNLNGAIIEAVKVIEKAHESSDVPLRFGTVVVFTDGTDRAHRATSRQAISAVQEGDVAIYVIGIGGEMDHDEMKKLGRDGFVHVENQEAMVQAFKQVGERIQRLGSRFYLLSYCSPSRAGRHRLEVEAFSGEEKGSLSYEFEAEGFEPDCNPNSPPSFSVPGAKEARKKKRTSSPPKDDGRTQETSEKPSSESLLPPTPGY